MPFCLTAEMTSSAENFVSRSKIKNLCGCSNFQLRASQDNPQGVWLTGYIAMQNLTPIMADDKETVQDTKRQRWYGEKVHGSDGFAMVRIKASQRGWIGS